MDKIRDVAVIVGSLRKDSINRKVANALAELAPAGLKLTIIEIGHYPSTARMATKIPRLPGWSFTSG
jgi:NAD(P)H-dependent FMN reductase